MNVIITGASRGIGFAIAEIFAQNGHNLLLTSLSDVKLYKAMETLQTKYSNISIAAKAFDLSVKENAIAFAEWCLEKAAGPDVLVNNTGIFQPGNVLDEPDGTLESQVAVNLYSAYYITRTIAPRMIQQRSGHIFNISSVAALKAYPGGGSYSISKYALLGFTKNLRHELMPHGVKVTAVLPGAVMTDSWSDFDNSESRIMQPQDIAQMVYAASQLSAAACVEEIIVRPLLGDL